MRGLGGSAILGLAWESKLHLLGPSRHPADGYTDVHLGIPRSNVEFADLMRAFGDVEIRHHLEPIDQVSVNRRRRA